MKNKTILVTGAAGLIGSQAVSFFCEQGFQVIGIENNMREYFFGPQGNVQWNLARLHKAYENFQSFNKDIRREEDLKDIFQKGNIDCIIHTAAQPSHDWAAQEPLTDFSVNAQGTLMLLECMRTYTPGAVFIFTSTNKVYGDRPNTLPFIELPSRFDLPKEHQLWKGIDETMSVDASLHSLFGVSKLSADMLVQEYGRYFGLKTVTFRGGCLTGECHSGVELHGFLSYLVKCIVQEKPYTIYGYKGKQVRDNIHAADVVTAAYQVFKNPKCGEVYNIGGGRTSNISVIEAIKKIEERVGKKARIVHDDTARRGDHQWYITDMSKFKRDYPEWSCEYSLDRMLDEMCEYEIKRLDP